ncbi:MAG: VWA domain-containing protein [Candidatus Acidiferrales bacterium]
MGQAGAEAQPSPKQATAPPLHSTTRLVQVSVVVQDKRGDPILRLTKNDFSLLDEKQAQAIQLFSVHTNAMPKQAPPALPPDTFTNRLEERTAVPKSVTVILLDALNTEVSDQEKARRQVIKFMGQLQPQDRVGIYTLDYRLNVLHDFTTDASELLAALNKYKGERLPDEAASVPHQVDSIPQRGPGGAGGDPLQRFLSLSIEREANYYTRKRVLITTNALQAIAHHLGSLPGRKNLVWISGSFPINVGYEDATKVTPTQFHDQWEFREDVERAANALSDANVSVYPVDARGLLPSEAGVGSRATLRRSTTPAAGESPAESSQNLATMSMLADQTGGRIFYANNDLFEGVRLAIVDSRVTYELGYYPEGVKWDGKFHSIRVKVNRPGARVRARTGYFARPGRSVTKEEQDAFVVAAAYSPIEATAIKMVVQVHAAEVAGSERMNLFLHFDPRDIAFQQVDENWEANAEVVYAQTDEKGAVLDVPSATMDMKFTAERYEQLLKSGISYTRDVPINRNAVELRVILRDNSTSAIGSVIIPLKNYFPSSDLTH